MNDRIRHHRSDAPERVKDLPSWLITRAFGRAGELLVAGFEEHGSGLRSHHYRLLAAVEEDGPASQASLGRRIGLDPSDVTAALSDLEARGLVTRTVDPAHRRRKLVTITPDGMVTLKALDKVIAGVQERLLEPLSPAERRTFVKLLRRVTAI